MSKNNVILLNAEFLNKKSITSSVVFLRCRSSEREIVYYLQNESIISNIIVSVPVCFTFHIQFYHSEYYHYFIPTFILIVAIVGTKNLNSTVFGIH